MNEKVLSNQRVLFTSIISIGVWILLIWDHFNGGVPSHHILNRSDLPEISNWWGGVLLPLVIWILLDIIKLRVVKESRKEQVIAKFPKTVIYSFLAAFIFGVLISILFLLDFTDLAGNMFITLFVIGFFIPFYKSEYILGFILGLTYTFGGILPILIAAVLSTIGAFIHLVVRPSLVYLYSEIFKGADYSK